MNNRLGTVIALWFMGYSITIAGLASLAYGFIRECETVSCRIDGLMWQSGGIMTAFIGAVLVVMGYSAKAKAELKRIESLKRVKDLG